MFAFAIWERDSGRVLLGRDRLGIKPLYLQECRQGLRFASSLPALLAAGDVDTSLDPTALHHYLTFHAVVPAPHTILRGVRKLPPRPCCGSRPTVPDRAAVTGSPISRAGPAMRSAPSKNGKTWSWILCAPRLNGA